MITLTVIFQEMWGKRWQRIKNRSCNLIMRHTCVQSICAYICAFSLAVPTVLVDLLYRTSLRWNSWMAFLVEVFGHSLESSLTRVFCLVFTLSFLFYKMLLMKRLEFSCFADFFTRFFKTREEYGFLWNPPVEGTGNKHGAKDSSLLFIWCPRMPSQVL